jgi:hypothetical protein
MLQVLRRLVLQRLRHRGRIPVMGRAGAVGVVAGAAGYRHRAMRLLGLLLLLLLRGGVLVGPHRRLTADGADPVTGRGRRLRCKSQWSVTRPPEPQRHASMRTVKPPTQIHTFKR